MAGCDPNDFYYCPTSFCYVPKPDPIVIEVPEISFDPNPQSFTETSPNVFVATGSLKHELDRAASHANLQVTGGGGDDIIQTGSGNDVVYGGGGYDIIRTSFGNDLIRGGDKLDHITAGHGNDSIYGEEGDDYLFGQIGNDTVYGGVGDDKIWGGAGIDILRGEDGNDIFTIEAGEDSFFEDSIYGGNGVDTIEIQTDDLASVYEIDLSLLEAKDIEIIDLIDPGDHVELTLSVSDVLAITDNNNELTIKGDEDDAVISIGEGWVQQADQGNYNVYTSGGAILLVDHEIFQDIS